ncbi:MAG: DUF2256 domain-containing protein [Acidithiobacillus sp.]
MTRSHPQRPEKICPVCQRPFSWRKRWERCWSEVVYCSDACRKRRQHCSKGHTHAAA